MTESDPRRFTLGDFQVRGQIATLSHDKADIKRLESRLHLCIAVAPAFCDCDSLLM